MNFLEAHGRSYGYAYCVSPVSKLPTKPQNCRFPIVRCRFCSALPLAPLRKGSCRRSRLRGRLFSGALRMYLCVYCVSPVSKLPTKPQNCRFPILRCRFCSALPLAPLRKGSCRRSRLRGRLFSGALRMYLCVYCVSPVSKLPTKSQNCRFPIVRYRFAAHPIGSPA